MHGCVLDPKHCTPSHISTRHQQHVGQIHTSPVLFIRSRFINTITDYTSLLRVEMYGILTVRSSGEEATHEKHWGRKKQIAQEIASSIIPVAAIDFSISVFGIKQLFLDKYKSKLF
jgi:hypothetical protein